MDQEEMKLVGDFSWLVQCF